MATALWTVICFQSTQEAHTISTTAPEPKSGIEAFFSTLHAPFSLFPPNAVISLTHDNTTVFMARPAAFGPLLPTNGLKGQLWIGSGFGDDSLRQGAVAAAEGELGCSDVPGWIDSFAKAVTAVAEGELDSNAKSAITAGKTNTKRRARDEDSPFDEASTRDSTVQGKASKGGPSADDGTDDYLHHPLPESSVSKSNDKASADSKGDHADIQSLQEGAEISGKVVLLSRGGCGFLEKVKWAQRRGAIALIVGDDTKGGPLIQMYARGDTSNVSIPSIFTSRTTAHLLSSLIGPGSFIEDTLDENGRPLLKVQHSANPKKAGKKQGSHPTFTRTTAVVKATSTSKTTSKGQNKKQPAKVTAKATSTETKPGWFKSLFMSSGKADSKSESSRPPSSGQLDWVLVDDWKDDDTTSSKKISTKPSAKAGTDKKVATKPKIDVKTPAGSDDFIIGVQDWRDPDLVGSKGSKETDPNAPPAAVKVDGKEDATIKLSSTHKDGKKKHLGGALQEIPEYVPKLRGGSITPGSGEYATKDSISTGKAKENDDSPFEAEEKSKGLLTTIFGDDEEDVEFLTPSEGGEDDMFEEDDGEGDDEEEGLWVTLTPTSASSPFLDTLLVLVVSPLVTLTIVYTLLLIRSRIRRRRWRAPKSVVERLPVRTYQTIVPNGSQSPRLPSPTSSSITTPLLQQSPPTRPRPRSRTTTGVPEPGDLARVNSNPLQLTNASRASEYEKHESEWRKHMNKQVECVVCLEEYVDGVSRVMSLPCGHEFHVDCM